MNLAILKNKQVVTSSRQVAEVFGKRHDVVLRAIEDKRDNLTAEKYGDLFYETKYVHPQNKQEYKEILMNRDGFTLLAMGFTGAKADQWKLKYIEAFNKMEEAIKTKTLSPMDQLRLQYGELINDNK